MYYIGIIGISDVQGHLVEAGYHDSGGRSYPTEKEHLLLKPTMIIEYSKEIQPKKIGTEVKGNSNETIPNIDISKSMATLLDEIDDITNISNISSEGIIWNNMTENLETYPIISDIEPRIAIGGAESVSIVFSSTF